MTTQHATSPTSTEEQKNNPTTSDNSNCSEKAIITNETVDDTAYYQCADAPVAVIRQDGAYMGCIGEVLLPERFPTQELAVDYFENTLTWRAIRVWMYYEMKELLNAIEQTNKTE